MAKLAHKVPRSVCVQGVLGVKVKVRDHDMGAIYL